MQENIRTQSWVQLTCIYVGGAICLPVILIGHELGLKFGFWPSMIAITFGNLALLFLSLLASSMGSKTQKSTADHIHDSFGPIGGSILNIVMMSSLLSWFAIQLNMMNLSLIELNKLFRFPLVHPVILQTALGLAIAWFARSGLKSLGLFSYLCVPLLVITLGWSVWSQDGGKPDMPVSFLSFEGASLVIATSIAAVIDMPNFFRYARSHKDSLITVTLLFGVALPVIEGIGVYLAMTAPESSLLEVMQAGNGLLWMIWVTLFLLLAGWTTNNTNLFSVAVMGERFVPGSTLSLRILVLGVLGTILALTNPMDHLGEVINLLGVAIGSLGGVLLAAYLSKAKKISHAEIMHLAAWAFGAILGVLGVINTLFITGIPLLDAYVGAFLLTWILHQGFYNHEIPNYE